DGEGAALLMEKLGIKPRDLRTRQAIERWQDLCAAGDTVDAEGAIANAGVEGLDKARAASLPVPEDLDPLRYRDDLDSLRSRDQSWIATAGQLPSRPPQTS